MGSNEMSDKTLICYDFRNPLNEIATVDKNIWPGPSKDFSKILEEYGVFLNICNFSFDFLFDIPINLIKSKYNGEFCINSYFVSSLDVSKIEEIYGEIYFSDKLKYYYARNLIIENWRSIGFDICSIDMSVSAIYSTKEINIEEVRKLSFVNKYGLIKNIKNCHEIISSSKFKTHDQVNFIPVEIYTNYF